jgi:serine/threonine protein phosphatase 1
MVAVIGDIHSCYNTLRALYKKVTTKYPGIEIYTTGDLVDRGNFAFETLNFIITKNIKPVMGNHDYMFYCYFRDTTSMMAQNWLYNNPYKTLLSYKNLFNELQQHLNFLKDLPIYYKTKDCFISHAGISEFYAGQLIINDELRDELFYPILYNTKDVSVGILWNRDQIMNIGLLQIVGHTPQNEIRYDHKANAYYIDTGCVYGDKLTAAIIHENNLIDFLEEEVHTADIK